MWLHSECSNFQMELLQKDRIAQWGAWWSNLLDCGGTDQWYQDRRSCSLASPYPLSRSSVSCNAAKPPRPFAANIPSICSLADHNWVSTYKTCNGAIEASILKLCDCIRQYPKSKNPEDRIIGQKLHLIFAKTVPCFKAETWLQKFL